MSEDNQMYCPNCEAMVDTTITTGLDEYMIDGKRVSVLYDAITCMKCASTIRPVDGEQVIIDRARKERYPDGEVATNEMP